MTAWHTLTPEQTAQALEAGIDDGLGAEEAAARLGRYGPNRLTGREAMRWYQMLARQFASVLIAILVIAAMVIIFLPQH